MHKLCVLEVDNTEYKIPEKVIKSYQKLQQENQQLKEQLNNPLRGIFAQVNDDDLLRSTAMYYAENNELQQQLDKYKSIVNKAIELLSKINYEDINEYIPPLEILPVYEILKELEEGNSND